MSSTPPPKKPAGSDHPGLVSRQPKTVADAIPTEAEGDALFDELFGDDPYGGEAPPADDDEPATMMVDRSAFSGTPLGLGPQRAPVQAGPPPQQAGPPQQPGPLQRPRPPLGPPPGGFPGRPIPPLQPPPPATTGEDEDYETHRPPAPETPVAMPVMPEHTLPIQPAPMLPDSMVPDSMLADAALPNTALPDSMPPDATLGEALVEHADDVIDDAAETGEHLAISEEDLIDTNQYPRADLPAHLQPPGMLREPELPLPVPPAEDSVMDLDEAVLIGDSDDIAFDDVSFDEAEIAELTPEPGSVDFADAIRPAAEDPLGATERVDEEEKASYTPDPPELEPALPEIPTPPPLDAQALDGDGDDAIEAYEEVFERADVSGDAEVMDLDAEELAAIEAAEAELADGLTPDASENPSLGDGPAFSYEEAEASGNDAVVSLMQAGQRDAWVERASWLYEEAPLPNQATDRARALLVVSELLAMAGEEERAETVAREALQLAPSLPMAHRQLRGILMARGRWTEVADALDSECRVAPTNDAKFHAAYLGAEVARLAQGDPEGSSRRLDTAERVGRDDVRVPLARIMQALASSDEVPTVQATGPSADALTPSLEILRGIRSEGAAADPGETPYGALLRARAGLRKRDVAGAVAALGALERVDEFSPGASWLISALAAPHAELRAEAVNALARVSDGSHGAVATRARAARALELGDAAVVSQLANEAADDVLSATERLILAALAGASLQDPKAWLEQAADAEPALAAATAAVLNADAVELGEPSTRAAVLLGRALAAATTGDASAEDAPPADDKQEDEESLPVPMGALVAPSTPPPKTAGLPSTLVEAATELLEADSADGVARAVMLENSYATGQVGRVAAALASESAEGFGKERSLAAALLSEIAGDYEQMEGELERVLAEQPDHEAAMRMTMVIAEPAIGAAALARFANSVEDETRAAIALTEAGLRLMEEEGQEADGEALLRAAADKAPDLPVAAFIGLYVAQALGDDDGEQFWFELRRRAAIEPADAVMDTVRQAVRMGADATAEQATLLGEAHRARPGDYCLRELFERASGVSGDRAAWLMERASDEPGDEGQASAAPLALEAALASELDGDVELAARCARRALELGDNRLAPIFTTRFALRGQGADETLEKLQGDIREASEPQKRAELYELIAHIERGRGEDAKAVEALRAIIAEQSTTGLAAHVAALHELEAMAFANGDASGLADVSMAIASAVEGSESVAHAMMAARLIHERDGWASTYDAVQLAFNTENPSLWSMRQMAAHARARGDHATAAGIDCTLAERTDMPLDRATLLIRGAEATLASGDDAGASELLGEVIELWPRHQVALLERGGLFERSGATADAARCFEELGMVCKSPGERAAKLYKAATLWLSLETSEGQDEGRRLLEAVDADYEDTFERLQAIYLAAGAKRELADLLSARLENVDDPAERVEIEVMRGRMLVEAGSAGEAREALQAALDANPDNPDALSAFADVCAAEGEWEEVEQSIIRLGRLVSDPDKQCQIYLRLGALYDEHIPNLERAEMAYQEVLKRAPENTVARAKLVDLYLKSGDPQRAFDQQQELINAAKSPGDKCVRTVKLASIYEATGDEKQAEQTLVKARRTWNKEAAPVTALYQFYKRNGQAPAAEILLDRASADVRRGLGAGRFEAPLFAMAQTVAELRGQADAARIAQATLGAITGEPAYIEGSGLLAGQPELDEHTAPEVLTTPFRQLLRATGDVMDEAVPFDLGSIRAKPLPPLNADVIERTREIAAAYGIPSVEIVATNALGRVCVPVQSEPPTLCFGLPLVTAEETDTRDFLIHRALKVLQTRTAALSRTAPIDLWPLVAAYLQLHSASFKPQGVDNAKVAAFKEAMAKVMPPPDPQLSLLASEVIGSIGNRASSLNTITHSWGSRTALLAMGDPNLALEAIAWASGSNQGPPASGSERVRWIGRQAEARDLIVFSVSDGYSDARSALGIGTVSMNAGRESAEFIDVEEL